jgi:hypothetical protein
MLSTNKQIMDSKFDMLSKKGSAAAPDTGGAIYKAAYHAYYDKTYERINATEDPTDEDIKADLASRGMLKQNNIEKLKNEAHEFASLFADAMKECLDEISTQVDQHIKAAQINIVIPALTPTIVSPTGPCTGSLIISESTGAQITIS